MILDVKSGREQPSPRAQLMIYMYAIPRALPEYRNASIAGEIVYPSRVQRVPRGGVDQGFVQRLGSLIRRVAADKPPGRVPSVPERRFCDITAADCPERVEPNEDAPEGMTADFRISADEFNR